MVFVTRKDFSFLRGIVMYGMILALVVIVAAVVFGLNLGTWFSVAMVGLAGAAILYDTSNVLHHYPEDKHVAASLQLFASIALMFWYVLQLFLGGRDSSPHADFGRGPCGGVTVRLQCPGDGAVAMRVLWRESGRSRADRVASLPRL